MRIHTTEARFELQRENVKLMTLSFTNLLQNMSLERYPSCFVTEMITYRIGMHYKEELTTVSLRSSPNNIDSLRVIALSENYPLIVNLSDVIYTSEKRHRQVEIHFQVYDQISDSIIYSGIGKGIDRSDEFSDYVCGNGQITCAIHNAYNDIQNDLLNALGTHIPNNRYGDAIRNDQAQILSSDTSARSIDLSKIRQCINLKEYSISPSTIFYQLFNADSTKMMIFTLKDIGDPPLSFDYLGNTYSALFFQNKWYVKEDTRRFSEEGSQSKAEERYLLSSLENRYFLEGTATPNPDFWETGAFEKIGMGSKYEKLKTEMEVYQRHLDDPNSTEEDKETCKIMLEMCQSSFEYNTSKTGLYRLVVEQEQYNK